MHLLCQWVDYQFQNKEHTEEDKLILAGYNLRKGFSCVNNVKALYLSYELMWIYTADKQTEDLYSNWNAEGLSNQLLLSSCNLEFSKIRFMFFRR
jgi:hypothetical protein